MDHRRVRLFALFGCVLSAVSAGSSAAGAPDTPMLQAAQRQSMQPLGIFDGTWRGAAKVTLPDGKTLDITQTERVGPFLDGTIKVIEGRGYAPDGTAPFNAFAVISYSPQTGKYNFRSYAQGYSGDFPLEVRADGFTWSVNMGRATLRYTATVKDDAWVEIGERIVEGQAPVKTFEMTLRRVGATDWPAAGSVPPK
ncbi:MAG: hypothetical protein WCV99_18990 [Sterolibacterium sp.]|jgi:hypothetical protein